MAADDIAGGERGGAAQGQHIAQEFQLVQPIDRRRAAAARHHHQQQPGHDDRRPNGHQQIGALAQQGHRNGKGNQRLHRRHRQRAGGAHDGDGRVHKHPRHGVGQNAHQRNPAKIDQRQRPDFRQIDAESDAANQQGPGHDADESSRRGVNLLHPDAYQNGAAGEPQSRQQRQADGGNHRRAPAVRKAQSGRRTGVKPRAPSAVALSSPIQPSPIQPSAIRLSIVHPQSAIPENPPKGETAPIYPPGQTAAAPCQMMRIALAFSGCAPFILRRRPGLGRAGIDARPADRAGRFRW